MQSGRLWTTPTASGRASVASSAAVVNDGTPESALFFATVAGDLGGIKKVCPRLHSKQLNLWAQALQAGASVNAEDKHGHGLGIEILCPPYVPS